MFSWLRRVTIGLSLYAVGLITLAVFATAYDLWRANIRVPVDYRLGWDTYFSMVLVKSVADTGWYLNNPRLGTPGAMLLYDFPILDTGLFLLIKFLSYFITNCHILFNVVYFSTFILAAWSALFSARRLGVSIPIAMAVAILFAFAPYHYWRGTEHLILSDYASIPLVVLVSLWICDGGDSLFFRRDSCGRVSLGWQGEKSWTALFAAAAISLGNPYYVFFGSYFMVVSGLIACSRTNRRPSRCRGDYPAHHRLVRPQLIPVVAFQYRNGPNLLVASRSPFETSVYALHLTDMLEPTVGHRLESSFQPVVLDSPDSRPQTPHVVAHSMNEARLCSPLGFLGASGLLYLLAWFAGPMNIADRKTAPILQGLAQLTLAALLLAVSGGMCEVIAAHFFSIIRCYNRMSIYIEFMALLKLEVLADSGRRRFGWTGPKFVSAIAAVVLFGLLDQTPVPITPDHQAEADAFQADRRFVQQIEADVASGSRIFQLPHADSRKVAAFSRWPITTNFGPTSIPEVAMELWCCQGSGNRRHASQNRHHECRHDASVSLKTWICRNLHQSLRVPRREGGKRVSGSLRPPFWAENRS